VLALKLSAAPTNAEIERFSAENPGYRFERDLDGALVVSPTGSMSGLRNARLGTALARWNEGLPRPGFCFDSSTGFALPDGSLISPDAAWIAHDRWLALPTSSARNTRRSCPTSSSKSHRKRTSRRHFGRSSSAAMRSAQATYYCSTLTGTSFGPPARRPAAYASPSKR
jgi:hypothetical protein